MRTDVDGRGRMRTFPTLLQRWGSVLAALGVRFRSHNWQSWQKRATCVQVTSFGLAATLNLRRVVRGWAGLRPEHWPALWAAQLQVRRRAAARRRAVAKQRSGFSVVGRRRPGRSLASRLAKASTLADSRGPPPQGSAAAAPRSRVVGRFGRGHRDHRPAIGANPKSLIGDGLSLLRRPPAGGARVPQR